jgi:hypothetical protein
MLNVEGLAASLREIEPTILVQTAGLRRVWFQGAGPYFDVFVDLDDTGKLDWFQCSLRGRVVTWDRTRGLQTGNTNEMEIRSQGVPGTKVMVNSMALDQDFIAMVRQILDAHEDPRLAQARAVLA